MGFLEFAMNASFNINTTFENFTVPKHSSYRPQLQSAYLRVDNRTVQYDTFSSCIENHEIVYAIPRLLTVSVEWF